MSRGLVQSILIVGAVGLVIAATGARSDDAPPRLKYRAKGSVCGCSSGLSEADISRAMAGLDNLRPAVTDQPTNGDNRTKQQTRREADDAGREK
jgi:hypothetical protein